MSDSPIRLLDKSRAARDEAERLLQQASGMRHGDIKSVLTGMAAVLQCQATDLEQRAFKVAPPTPQEHPPQQMRQAHLTPAKPIRREMGTVVKLNGG